MDGQAPYRHLGLAEPMSRRELRADAIVGLAFVLVAVTLAVLAPGRGATSPAVLVLFVLLNVVTSRIEFDVGSGYSVPPQLVLLPMLYAVPPGTVPLLVAPGFIVGKLPAYLRGPRHAIRPLVVDSLLSLHARDGLPEAREPTDLVTAA